MTYRVLSDLHVTSSSYLTLSLDTSNATEKYYFELERPRERSLDLESTDKSIGSFSCQMEQIFSTSCQHVPEELAANVPNLFDQRIGLIDLVGQRC